MGDWFRIEWYGAIVCFHRCLPEVFKPENSEVRGIIPEWQAVSPAKGQYGAMYRQCIEMEGRKEEAGGRMAPFYSWVDFHLVLNFCSDQNTSLTQ